MFGVRGRVRERVVVTAWVRITIRSKARIGSKGKAILFSILSILLFFILVPSLGDGVAARGD